jgi:hypothetical protein
MRHVGNNLAGYLEGALPPAARERVERHVASCGRCRAELAEMRAAGLALTEAGRAAPVPAHDDALWSRVHSEIQAAPPVRPFMPRWALPGAAALAAAAIAAVLVVRPGSVPAPVSGRPQMVAKAPAPVSKPGTPRVASVPEIQPSPVIAAPTATFSPPTRVGPRKVMVPTDRVPRTRLLEAPTVPAERDAAGGAAASGNRMVTSETPEAVPPAAPLGALDAPMATASATPPAPLPAKSGVLAYHDDTPAAMGAPAASKPAAEASPAAPPAGFGGGQAPTAAPSLRMQSRRAATADRSLAKDEAGVPLFAEARADLEAGNVRQAAQRYARALAAGLPPAQAREAHIALGDIAVDEKDDASAARHYAAALAIAPDAGLSARLARVRERLDHAAAQDDPAPTAPVAPK